MRSGGSAGAAMAAGAGASRVPGAAAGEAAGRRLWAAPVRCRPEDAAGVAVRPCRAPPPGPGELPPGTPGPPGGSLASRGCVGSPPLLGGGFASGEALRSLADKAPG